VHVDLFVVRMTEEMAVDVPIVPVGVSEAVATHGGTLLQVIDTIRVRALPDHLPQQVEMPIDRLVDFDAVLKVSDLSLPADVTVLTDADEVIAKVAPPRVETEAEAGEAQVEAEEGAPAGEAEATAPEGGEEA
jgi:large subunit ribosomal protein L25